MPKDNSLDAMMRDPFVLRRFADWWTIYPRKAGKGDALKAFAKCMRSERIGFEELIERTKAYREARLEHPGHPQFTPYPATWLNRWQYEDDPEPPPASGEKLRRTDVFDAVRGVMKRL